ncbi:DUF433 domain-containing protein [Alicyclobacillus acidoterrestris]|uniref:DUF433 domain-containing protein n=1 Tax=Alicyclobacillus acidoterrestris (strain ATCC 49025 / DSM 3922 / CIP 106132 / NCIMB 13137 / GD3B) TaxID=1356854 RepID=T0C528_ALIAG|nr:DUF433 domain-containing protein [Alicyclobacillus acidoterrestris]EPZ47645.1 hypothetical protein N007_05145 [Alicyclobacillus acidoterrestris ATCC 49025]UNO48035.1 DUF433 domain-containing protein [Alicyclobacillus acidoterrestris]
MLNLTGADRVKYLQGYLEQLIKLSEQGNKVYREINTTMEAIQHELGLEETRKVNIDYHLSKHPLIDRGLDGQPRIIGTSLTVREILNDLANGRTVDWICDEYGVDTNEVRGAIIFAAYVVSDSVY